MPTDAEIQAQQAQLERERTLIRQHQQQPLPDPVLIRETSSAIALHKALLRAWGVAVEDCDEDGPREMQRDLINAPGDARSTAIAWTLRLWRSSLLRWCLHANSTLPSATDREALDLALWGEAWAFAQVGLGNTATRRVCLIEPGRLRNQAVEEVAFALGCAGWDSATALASTVGGTEQQTRLLVSVASGLAQAGQQDTALAYAQQALQIAQEELNQQILAEALGTVAATLVEIGQVKQAVALVSSLEDAKQRSFTQEWIAGLLAQCGHPVQARALVQAITSPDERIIALAHIAHTLAEAGEAEHALRCGEEALGSVERLAKEEQRAQVRGLISMMYGWLGQTEAVEQLAQQIKDPLRREEQQADLVQALVQAKQFDAAAQRVQEISHWQTKQESLETLAIGLVRAGQGEAAVEQARLIESVYDRPRVLIHIARVLVQRGQEQQASECLVEAARLLDDEEEQEFRIDILHKLTAAARLISDPAVTLSLVQRLWSQAQTRDDLYALLPAAAPLFVADPTLLPQILAGEEWVKEQLKW